MCCKKCLENVKLFVKKRFYKGSHMDKIKVLIADDQSIVAEGISALLSMVDDFEVVKVVENGTEVLDALKVFEVDVVLMDIRMPIMNGVECTSHVSNDYPNTKVLILTTFDDDEYIRQAIKNGAVGYLLKDLSAEKLSAAIRNVYYGNTVMHQEITKKLVSGMTEKKELPHIIRTAGGEVLTPRENEVLKLLAKGLTNGEIACELFLSSGTVKNYITLLYDKLGIKGRTKLMTYAIDLGLLDES